MGLQVPLKIPGDGDDYDIAIGPVATEPGILHLVVEMIIGHFAYTLNNGGHFTTMFIVNGDKSKYDGLNPTELPRVNKTQPGNVSTVWVKLESHFSKYVSIVASCLHYCSLYLMRISLGWFRFMVLFCNVEKMCFLKLIYFIAHEINRVWLSYLF